jgi:AcrR family transcriptional regulator
MCMTTEKAPLGKREQRKAERREAILDIAQQSFLDQGYDRTTMSGVAEAMGGSKGTLWSYFDSKEALFAAVIDRAAAHFRADLTGALDPKGKPETGLRISPFSGARPNFLRACSGRHDRHAHALHGGPDGRRGAAQGRSAEGGSDVSQPVRRRPSQARLVGCRTV